MQLPQILSVTPKHIFVKWAPRGWMHFVSAPQRQPPLRNDCMQHTAPTVIWYLSMLVLPVFSSTVSSFLLFCPLLSCNLLFCSSVTCCCCCTPPCPCLLGLLKGNVLNSLFLFANTY